MTNIGWPRALRGRPTSTCSPLLCTRRTVLWKAGRMTSTRKSGRIAKSAEIQLAPVHAQARRYVWIVKHTVKCGKRMHREHT